jgi:hypothetical protein
METTAASAKGARPSLSEFHREIRRLHGCVGVFQRFVVVPETRGGAGRVVAVFALSGHPARCCYAWAERRPDRRGRVLFAVLHGESVKGPEDAIRHVENSERASRERWEQEYA